jgi:hypothetical protein
MRDAPADELPRCLRCQGEMTPGFLVDHGYGTQLQARWVAGERRTGWAPKWIGIETPPDPTYLRVISLRCDRCGYLESYAREPIA